MKIAIFSLLILALLGPMLVRVVAYTLNRSWTETQIDAVGAVIKWMALGAVIMLTIDVLVGF